MTPAHFRHTGYIILSATIVFFLFCMRVTAQTMPTDALPKESIDLLAGAAETYGIAIPGAKPWRLLVTFRLFDEQGKPKDHGTYEEHWESRTSYRRIYSSALFSQIEFQSQNGTRRTGNQHPPSEPLSLLRFVIAEPFAETGMIAALASGTMDTRSSGPSTWIIGTRQFNADGANERCFDLHRKVDSRFTFEPNRRSFCFGGSGSLMRSSIGFAGGVQATLTDFTHFQERVLPHDMVFERDGTVILSAHLENVDLLSQVDRADLHSVQDSRTLDPSHFIIVSEREAPSSTPTQPEINVLPAEMEEHIQFRISPDYPPVARARGVAGTVVLQATIGKDGSVENPYIISGPPLLLVAALDAVKQWKYRPYLVNSEPTEVHTQIYVTFTIDR